jgi:SAM-dependent methyltransferase
MFNMRAAYLARFASAALRWASRFLPGMGGSPESLHCMGALRHAEQEPAVLSKPFVFDRPLQSELRDAGIDFLRRVIAPWQSELGLRTALDMGCGVGYFSSMLRDLGLQVTGTDARAENIAEARSRNPDIDFRVADAEDSSLAVLGTFDLVVCFGLLYHLENPFRAVRNLRALTGKLLILQSMSVPDEQPLFFLLDEPEGADQSLHAVSCYPSEGAMVKMSYRAGFPHVYRFRELPNHEDFRTSVSRARVRTVIAASLLALHSPLITVAPEPKPSLDLWTTDPTGITRVLRRLRGNLKRSRSSLCSPFPRISADTLRRSSAMPSRVGRASRRGLKYLFLALKKARLKLPANSAFVIFRKLRATNSARRCSTTYSGKPSNMRPLRCWGT